jgi:hypothetical protein
MVAGRLTATSTYPEGMNVKFGPSNLDGKLRELLQLVILKEQATVRYELAGEGRQLSIVLAQNGDFSIRRTQDEPRSAVDFFQPTVGLVSLTIDKDGVKRDLRGASFWHLYLADPELLRRHLIPDLELLRPAWQLGATGWAIEEALLQRAQYPSEVDTAHWKHLVDELASGQFSKREGAQRELARVGQVALPFLEGLDRAKLDPEQASRVAALVEALSVNYEDTPDRIATWLVADEQAWMSILAREELVKRRLAQRQLSTLWGHPIDFDPAADAATRKAQLARLHARHPIAAKGDSRPAEAPPRSIPPPGLER